MLIAGTLSIAAFPCNISDNGSSSVILELEVRVLAEDVSVQVPDAIHFDIGHLDGLRSSWPRVEYQERCQKRNVWPPTDHHHCFYIKSHQDIQSFSSRYIDCAKGLIWVSSRFREIIRSSIVLNLTMLSGGQSSSIRVAI